jgi:hypothetical protein
MLLAPKNQRNNKFERTFFSALKEKAVHDMFSLYLIDSSA